MINELNRSESQAAEAFLNACYTNEYTWARHCRHVFQASSILSAPYKKG